MFTLIKVLGFHYVFVMHFALNNVYHILLVFNVAHFVYKIQTLNATFTFDFKV